MRYSVPGDILVASGGGCEKLRFLSPTLSTQPMRAGRDTEEPRHCWVISSSRILGKPWHRRAAQRGGVEFVTRVLSFFVLFFRVGVVTVGSLLGKYPWGSSHEYWKCHSEMSSRESPAIIITFSTSLKFSSVHIKVSHGPNHRVSQQSPNAIIQAKMLRFKAPQMMPGIAEEPDEEESSATSSCTAERSATSSASSAPGSSSSSFV